MAASLVEKFHQIEFNFNDSFLVTLNQLQQIVADQEDEQERAQYKALSHAYRVWYRHIEQDSSTKDACTQFYESVEDVHDLIMARDTQLWTVDGDFFGKLFSVEGLETEEEGKVEFAPIDTPYLWSLLDDGDDEEEGDDSRLHLWNAIIGLYRLSVLICIYLRMPLVKEIIDMILMQNPDINQQNIFEKIFSQFKGRKSRLRRLINKLMRSKGDQFGEIFDSLQKVVATFQGEVSMDPQKAMEGAQEKVSAMFDRTLEEHKVHLTAEEKGPILQALASGQTGPLDELVEEKRISPEQRERLVATFKQPGMSQVNMITSLGSTMKQMMHAIETKDEEKLKAIAEETGANLPFDMSQLEDLSDAESDSEADDEDDDCLPPLEEPVGQ